MRMYEPVDVRLKSVATLFYFVRSCTDLHGRVKYHVLKVAPAMELKSALTVILLVTLLEYAVPTCVSASARAY